MWRAVAPLVLVTLAHADVAAPTVLPPLPTDPCESAIEAARRTLAERDARFRNTQLRHFDTMIHVGPDHDAGERVGLVLHWQDLEVVMDDRAGGAFVRLMVQDTNRPPFDFHLECGSVPEWSKTYSCRRRRVGEYCAAICKSTPSDPLAAEADALFGAAVDRCFKFRPGAETKAVAWTQLDDKTPRFYGSAVAKRSFTTMGHTERK